MSNLLQTSIFQIDETTSQRTEIHFATEFWTFWCLFNSDIVLNSFQIVSITNQTQTTVSTEIKGHPIPEILIRRLFVTFESF